MLQGFAASTKHLSDVKNAKSCTTFTACFFLASLLKALQEGYEVGIQSPTR